MKYAHQIKQYIEGNGNIGDRHEEPEDDHPRDPLTGAQLRDIDPEFEEPQETPKKKRGRPVGSKTKKKNPKKPGPKIGSARTTQPHTPKNQVSVRMTPELFELLHKEADENFRGPGQEINYILTQYYRNNGKL